MQAVVQQWLKRAVVIGLDTVLVATLWGGFSLPAATAQDLPPRPTVVPVATASPTTPPTDAPHKERRANPARYGVITGTVIDATTGAPAPHVSVLVDGVRVFSNADGNYDRWVSAPGFHTVALALDAEQGVATQPALSVEVLPGAVMIQHLVFRSAPARHATIEIASTLRVRRNCDV